MDVLVTYDIAVANTDGAARLRRTAQVCEKYGQRVQFSVFECRLAPERLERLIDELENVIDSRLDSVIVYRFPGRIDDARCRYGRCRSVHEIGQPWML